MSLRFEPRQSARAIPHYADIFGLKVIKNYVSTVFMYCTLQQLRTDIIHTYCTYIRGSSGTSLAHSTLAIVPNLHHTT